MLQKIQRVHPRTDSSATIHYAAVRSESPEQFRATRMRNYSAGGMCFETDLQLEPEAEVCVVMPNYSPDQSGPEGYRSYLTKVCWIEPLSIQNNGRYATGARIIARSHDILVACNEKSHQFCDLCGVLLPVHRLHTTAENAQLCGRCHTHFQSIPEGKIRACVSRFLVGNVV